MPDIEVANYKRLTIDKLNNEGCMNVFEALLADIREEFISKYKDYLFHKNDKNNCNTYFLSYKRIKNYILSDDFAALTGLDGASIVTTLETTAYNDFKWAVRRYYNGKVL